jgi:hypothetical protein
MPIINSTIPASNFTQISNDLINSTIPPESKAILFYLLSKPVNWKIEALDIQKQLGLTAYSARKALRWLVDNNYLQWERLKSGNTIWQICDKAGV